MSGSNSSPPGAADPRPESPLDLTVHSLPPLGDADAADPQRTRAGRWKMLAVLLVCAAPVIASYFTYYVIRPEGRRNFGELIEPQRPMPEMLGLDLEGRTHPLGELKGQWLLVSLQGTASAVQKSALKKELLWEGFAPLSAGLFASPGDKREALTELLTRTRMNGKVIVLSATDAGLAGARPIDEITPSAWPTKEATKAYRKFITRFDELRHLLAMPGRPDSATAFTLRTLLIHEYRRTLLGDPQLPASLLGEDWPGKQAQALCRSLYLALETDADRHIAQTLALEQDEVPPVAPSFTHRFKDR